MPLSPCARSCALSPDGSLAVAGFDDGSLKVCIMLTDNQHLEDQAILSRASIELTGIFEVPHDT